MAIHQKTYNINLDYSLKTPIPRMTFVQGDRGTNIINITLTDNQIPVDLTGLTVNLTIKKFDNTLVYQQLTIQSPATSGNIQAVLTSNTLAVVGNASCEVAISDFNNNVLTTLPFSFTVVGNYSNGISSTNEYSALVNATNNAIAFVSLGTYDNTQAYVPLNKVTYLGSTYQNILACTGVLPTVNGNNANWLLISQKGSDGFSSIVENNFVATADNTTHIVHNLSYDPLYDNLQVLYYGEVLKKGTHYTENADNISIDLGGWSILTGEIIDFKLYKHLNESTIQANEDIRISNEDTRIANENARVSAENTRVSNEDDRVATMNAFKVNEPYDNTHSYVPLNKVTYQGSSYICIADSQGIAPSTDETKWLMIAQKGNDGLSSMLFSTFTATADNTLHIVHNLNYDPTHDYLEVIDVAYNCIMTKDVNYTENADNISIDLISTTGILNGEKIQFILFKNIK